ncbi:hypothetical protein TD95_002143 [Thielaviopsis punctulata]|uniref:AB hydrolase-1 domain-containing protein n=1 Tax=Thielaviopsis punctulata TaxID=72032 RepID=A0A0F4Z5Y4_9PEZI|nr:hypothetical protein TD95_002143 [Thielaviopsis punctulata]
MTFLLSSRRAAAFYAPQHFRAAASFRHYATRTTASSPSSSSGAAAQEIPTAFNNIPTVQLSFEIHHPPNPLSEAPRPIVFMHGLFGCKKNNRTISNYRILETNATLQDLRNHGDSPHAQRHDYLSLAADVYAFITHLQMDKPTIIGHSMGAKTAMTLALAAPNAITDVIPVDNSPLDQALGSDFGKYIQIMELIERSNVMTRSAADKILEPYEPSLPIRQFLLQNLFRPTHDAPFKFRNPLGVLAKNLSHMGDFPFKDPMTTRFKKPALFVRGTKSTYVPDEVIPLIGDFFPLFRMVDIEAGHWVISENPAAFKDAVVAFLTREDSDSN